ncbi:MAG TPA: glycerate kinase [Candidatus Baltobacteraceae bacterium]|nr:glycerate kinase [Candidatus Baltobacteraceae bacterium]
MQILIAPDKFKGSCSAPDVAEALARGVRSVDPQSEITIIPMADGGEGTVAAFIAGGARALSCTVRGPLETPVHARFALDGTTAIVEMAAASGLVLLDPRERDARRASTYGTGEMIRSALDAGATRLLIGIGGSATNDAGAGMLSALGVRFLDERGRELEPGGAALACIASIDMSGLDARLRSIAVTVAADVDSPLCGRDGASVVYGSQKGASADDIVFLDAALSHFADVVAKTLGNDMRDLPGAGGAGGLGFALITFLGAKIRAGIDVIAEFQGLPQALQHADLCLTGEGRIDEQTLRGKTVAGVLRLARQTNTPVIAFTGSIDANAEAVLASKGVLVIPILDRVMNLDEAIREVSSLLERAAARAMRAIVLGRDPQ